MLFFGCEPTGSKVCFFKYLLKLTKQSVNWIGISSILATAVLDSMVAHLFALSPFLDRRESRSSLIIIHYAETNGLSRMFGRSAMSWK